MPGMPRWRISCSCCGVISRLSQTKPRLEDSRSRNSLVSRSGSAEVSSSTASSTSISLRGSANSEGAFTSVAMTRAVAVENVGPRGGKRVLRDGAAVGVVVAGGGEHHEPERDHAIDAGEGEHREAEPRSGLDVAVDAAAVEQRAQQPLPAGFACHGGHRGAAGTLPVASGLREHGADRIVRRRRYDLRRPLWQSVEVAELGGLDRLKLQVALRQALDALGRRQPRPLRAQRGDGVALVADLAAQLGDLLGLQRRVELDLVDAARRPGSARRSRRC